MKQNNIIIPVDHPLKNTLDNILPPKLKITLDTDDLPRRYWCISINYAAYNSPAYALCCLNGTPPRLTIVIDLYHSPHNDRAILINSGNIYIRTCRNKRIKEAARIISKLINS